MFLQEQNIYNSIPFLIRNEYQDFQVIDILRRYLGKKYNPSRFGHFRPELYFHHARTLEVKAGEKESTEGLAD